MSSRLAPLSAWLASPTALVCGVILLVVAGAYLALLLQRLRQRQRRRRRSAMAQRGERRAAKLLTRSGFEILERQAPRRWTVVVDDEPHHLELRVDFLVTKDSKLYVADAKTGSLAPSLQHGATRRQLLEYLLAYRASGALLLDMEQNRILEVCFPGI